MDTLEAITRGDYEEIVFVAEGSDGNPLNLNGKVIRFTAKRDFTSPTIVLTKNSAIPGQIAVDNAAAGEGRVILTGEEPGVRNINEDTTLACDIEVTDAQGRPATTRFMLPLEVDVST